MSEQRLLTGSQTVGPFFGPTLLRADARRNVLVQPGTVGERVRIEGIVRDGEGKGVPDALIEIWQANTAGRYHHPADRGSVPLDPSFTGFGRVGTGEDGGFWFETIKPGAVAFAQEQMQAPHINVSLFARGLLNHLMTRLYFAEERANATDPVLQLVPEDRRKTLLAKLEEGRSGNVYRFDILLQGVGETVFFNI